jgi:cytosine permease
MAQELPNYVASATPNPPDKRAGWLATTAAGNAGVMLWFVFWQAVPGGGVLSHGLGTAIAALVAAAAICFALFAYVPFRLGSKTGLPLYIVGTSVYGVGGGFYLPGLLMGILQYGWLAVNGYFSSLLLTTTFGAPANGGVHLTVGVIWTIVTALVGLGGMKYVGKVASYLPIIPVAVLVLLLVKTIGGVGSFDAATAPKLSADVTNAFGNGSFGVFHVLITFGVGFFATLGAANCDMGSGNSKERESALGGPGIGVFGSMVVTGVIALLAIAGTLGAADPMLKAAAAGANPATTAFLNALLGGGVFPKVIAVALVISAFPAACVSSMIGANSFKTVFPKINPLITCAAGTIAAIVLVITKIAADAGIVFNVIGASFGPVCGALAAEYILSGRKWSGPREGWNLAGWISWFFGLIIGGAPAAVALVNFCSEKPVSADVAGIINKIPVPPVTAFVVGFVLYFALAGIRSKPIELPQRIDA